MELQLKINILTQVELKLVNTTNQQKHGKFQVALKLLPTNNFLLKLQLPSILLLFQWMQEDLDSNFTNQEFSQENVELNSTMVFWQLDIIHRMVKDIGSSRIHGLLLGEIKDISGLHKMEMEKDNVESIWKTHSLTLD